MYKIAQVNNNGKFSYYLYNSNDLLNFKKKISNYNLGTFEFKDDIVNKTYLIKQDFFYKIKDINLFYKIAIKYNLIHYKFVRITFKYEEKLLEHYNNIYKLLNYKSIKRKLKLLKHLKSIRTIKQIINLYIPNTIIKSFNYLIIDTNNYYMLLNSDKQLNNNFLTFHYFNFLKEEEYNYLKINLKELKNNEIDFDVISPSYLQYKDFMEEYNSPLTIKVDNKKDYINTINDNIKSFIKTLLKDKEIKETNYKLLKKEEIKAIDFMINKIIPLFINYLKNNKLKELKTRLNKLFDNNNKKEIELLYNFITNKTNKEVILGIDTNNITEKEIKDIIIFFEINKELSLYKIIMNNLKNLYRELLFKK